MVDVIPNNRQVIDIKRMKKDCWFFIHIPHYDFLKNPAWKEDFKYSFSIFSLFYNGLAAPATFLAMPKTSILAGSVTPAARR